MTRDVVENILAIEKKAESLVVRANADAAAAEAAADRTINELTLSFKHDSKKLHEEQVVEVSDKVKKTADKIERALKDELEALAACVKKNRTRAKKEIMGLLLKK